MTKVDLTLANLRRRWAGRPLAPARGRSDWVAAVAQYDRMAAVLAATRPVGYLPMPRDRGVQLAHDELDGGGTAEAGG